MSVAASAQGANCAPSPGGAATQAWASETTVLQQAFHLPVEGGDCFAIYRAPAHGNVHATVLHLPAFGDEMNKARAMTARGARAFAASGCAVLQMDWFGCGDSAGDHADATLARWTDNAQHALAWLRSQHGDRATTWLWCLRAGALLVPALLQQAARDASLLLWQPLSSGKQYLNQLLRLKLAGSIMQPGKAALSAQSLRETLRAGETLDIGGYAVSPRLAAEIEAATFDIPRGHRGRVAWFEISASAALLSPAARTSVDAARTADTEITASVVKGPGFWQSVEIEHCEPLIAASAAVLAAPPVDAIRRDPAVL